MISNCLQATRQTTRHPIYSTVVLKVQKVKMQFREIITLTV